MERRRLPVIVQNCFACAQKIADENISLAGTLYCKQPERAVFAPKFF